MTGRTVRLIASALMATLLPAAARAQSVAEFYARANLRLIVAADPGASYDSDARLVARHLSKHLPGNPKITIENMLGASGRIAANFLYNLAPRDGSVIGAVQQSIPLAQLIGDTGVQYDAAAFSWIGSPVRPDEVIVVWHTTGVRSIEDAKKKEVVIGATTPTGMNYVYPKLVKEFLGARFKIVTGYHGAMQINLALERGEVEGRGSNPWAEWKTARPDWVRDGKIVPILQMTLTKRGDLPDVPRLIDLAPTPEIRSVFEVMSITADIGRPLLIPPGVPADRVAALRQAFDETVTDPEFLADAAQMEREISPVKGTELQGLVRRVLDTPKPSVELLKTALARR
jgi:tripartite-type tricarboxylate transporter receptor subunit TctC